MTWSYSKLSVFERCPQQYEYKYIQKLPQVKGDALMRGIALHDKCERFLKGDLKRVPKELEKIGPQLKRLKKNEAVAEEWWNFHNDWGWSYEPFQWLVAKLDAYCFPYEGEIEVVDFKTGKKYPEVKDQLNLYAVCAMSAYDGIESVSAKAEYIDTGETVNFVWSAGQIGTMKNAWTSRANRLLKAKKFKKSPSFHCRWCDFHKRKGGPCSG